MPQVVSSDKSIPQAEKPPNQLLLTTDLAARGIDIPEVDWIVQFDPPQWSDQFVHRVGRTARAGRSGNSLLFLTKPEAPYLNYLAGKQVKMSSLQLCGPEDGDTEQTAIE